MTRDCERCEADVDPQGDGLRFVIAVVDRQDGDGRIFESELCPGCRKHLLAFLGQEVTA